MALWVEAGKADHGHKKAAVEPVPLHHRLSLTTSQFSNKTCKADLERTLLAFAPVPFDQVSGLFKISRRVGIEVGFRSADFTYKQVEVGKFFDVPDESGKTEVLGEHRIPPAAEHSRGRLRKKENFLRGPAGAGSAPFSHLRGIQIKALKTLIFKEHSAHFS
jgi:hypothetical protein